MAFYTSSRILPFFLQMIAGVWLMVSVYRIWKFFRERNAADFIDTKALIRHALAFGLYLIAIVGYFTIWILHMWVIGSPKTAIILTWAELGWYITQYSSQVLMAHIFWGLGAKVERPEIVKPEENNADEEFESAQPEIVEFDEEAELEAAMWN